MRGRWLEANRRSVVVATLKGFEPSISTVTGWHVRPLHHRAAWQNETRSARLRAGFILVTPVPGCQSPFYVTRAADTRDVAALLRFRGYGRRAPTDARVGRCCESRS